MLTQSPTPTAGGCACVRSMVESLTLESNSALVLSSPDTLLLRLQWLFHAVCNQFCNNNSASVCVVQAWLPSQTASGDFTLHSEPRVAVLADPRFAQFRLHSCHSPVMFKNSMTGRVWRTGAVQVVQNLRLVPPSMHPRIYLTEDDLDVLGEALYIPVYDSARPGAGPMTVLEVLLPVNSQEPVCSADLLSFISAGLATLKLSVSNPVPQPIKRSALCGRRARATADSAPDIQQQACSSPDSASAASPTDTPSAATAAVIASAASSASQCVPSAHGRPTPALVIKAISGPSTTLSTPPPASVEDTAVTSLKLGTQDPIAQAQSCKTGQGKDRGAVSASGAVCSPSTGAAWDGDEVGPRKVRRISGPRAGAPRAEGKGLVRSQSSFHIASTPLKQAGADSAH